MGFIACDRGNTGGDIGMRLFLTLEYLNVTTNYDFKVEKTVGGYNREDEMPVDLLYAYANKGQDYLILK